MVVDVTQGTLTAYVDTGIATLVVDASALRRAIRVVRTLRPAAHIRVSKELRFTSALPVLTLGICSTRVRVTLIIYSWLWFWKTIRIYKNLCQIKNCFLHNIKPVRQLVTGMYVVIHFFITKSIQNSQIQLLIITIGLFSPLLTDMF